MNSDPEEQEAPQSGSSIFSHLCVDAICCLVFAFWTKWIAMKGFSHEVYFSYLWAGLFILQVGLGVLQSRDAAVAFVTYYVRICLFLTIAILLFK